MALHYTCRHCGTKIGTLSETILHSEQLGLTQLNDEERQDMIAYDSVGNVHVKAICEDCHEALQKNPDLHQNDYIIH
ncbi:anti-sigma-F factor Fin family protein [Bacillus cihuensis]|uniref:anti-sigma-F factor Fin family protein n=1 Tax=Bacillus cihuensis TaxID=1208599 RepID=UPI00048EE5FF|nr:anti-sigma-F factor Fin family protein [Bacillus cihuensis]